MAAAPITSVQSNVSWSCSKTLSHDESWPCPRGGGSLTAIGSELILFGGASVDGRHFNDTWSFNPTKERQEISLMVKVKVVRVALPLYEVVVGGCAVSFVVFCFVS